MRAIRSEQPGFATIGAQVPQRLGEKPKRRLLILIDLGRRDELVLDLIEARASSHGLDDQSAKP